jgi:hypothetical protein
MGDPRLTVDLNGGRAIFMLGAEDDADSVVNVDVEVILDDGSRWSATFLTVAEVSRILERWKATGECLNGSYLRVPDLVVVDRGGLDTMVAVLNSILASGDPATGMVRLGDRSDQEGGD